ncbi:MAG: PspC domain-containing protein [Peptococcaceae bacterium]|nr:PspC domain-containing protein [Peptococcaceae bacterium]
MKPTKKLTRSLTQRKIAGVCGGLGEYFNISPLIFRVTFLLLCLPGGVPGPALYLLFWIFMPSATIMSTFYTQRPTGGDQLGSDYKETIDV